MGATVAASVLVAVSLAATGIGEHAPAVAHAAPSDDPIGRTRSVEVQRPPATGVRGHGERHAVFARPQTTPLPIGVPHDWIVEIRRRDGTIARPRRLLVSGGMRMHGHGLPSRPEIERYQGEGRWRIDGLHFNMPGRWQLALRIVDESGADDVVLEVDVGDVVDDDGTSVVVGAWSEAQRRVLQGLSLSARGAPPDASGNRVADDPRAARLGEALFHDPGLSASGKHSCAGCHRPDRAFTDGRRTGVAAGRGTRNTPSLVDSAYRSWLYWDGRRDSLWSQALVPIEAPDELAGSRVGAIRHLAETPSLRAAYEAVFGDLPRLDALPAHATPFGEDERRAAWDALSPPRRLELDTAFANIGKAIAAYERTLLSPSSRFDRFVEALLAGDEASAARWLDASERRGLRQFIDPDNQCLNCHNGPHMSNGDFHNIGTGDAPHGPPDFGRLVGVQAALRDPFNCRGAYADRAVRDCSRLEAAARTEIEALMRGAFKVPGLRDVAATAPYMHDGRFATLEAVIEHYRSPPDTYHELRTLEDMSDADARDLAAFLRSLHGSADAVRTPLGATASTSTERGRGSHARSDIADRPSTPVPDHRRTAGR